MKKYFLILFLFAGLMACSTALPPPSEASNNIKTEALQPTVDSQMPAVIAVTKEISSPEVIYIGDRPVNEASVVGDLLGNNLDVIGVVLLIFTTLFGGLWLVARNKLKEIGELFLKAYEYTDDKKLDPDERADLKERFLKIFTKAPS